MVQANEKTNFSKSNTSCEKKESDNTDIDGMKSQFNFYTQKISKMKTTKIITRNLHLYGQTLAKVVPNNLKGRSKSSQEWLTRQLTDPFIEKAKMMNYR